MLCPRCQIPFDSSNDAAFCTSCHSTLQTHAHIAQALGLARTDRRIEPSIMHPPLAMFACPVCGTGHVSEARVLFERIGACNVCGAWWLGPGQLATLRGHITRDRAQVAPHLEEPQRPVARPEPLGEDRFAYDTRPVNELALPVALAIGLFAQLIGWDIFVWATASMWTHELGHAITSWLTGIPAVPLPFFTATAGRRRSLFLIMAVRIAIALAGYYAFRARRKTLLAFSVGLFALSTWLSVFETLRESEQWFLFAGQGGELIFSTALILAFYERLPGRWDFWRYPVLVLASMAFIRAAWIWIAVANGRGEMPHGSALGRSEDGDVERLVHGYGWTQGGLATAYLTVSLCCAAVIATAYIAGVLRARRAGRP